MASGAKWLLDQGIRPGHVALIGDSAGGALAVTTILRVPGLAVAGREDAAIALARHGRNKRDVRDERAEGPDRPPAT